MRLRPCAMIGFLLVTLLALPESARAQATTGTISGTVTDQSKSVLPGVTVHVRNIETGATRMLVTDERGGFRALNLSPGIYAVDAELPGFTTAKRDNLTVEIGRDVNADLALAVGAVSEQVTVQGAATNIELNSAVAGGVISAVTKSGTTGLHGTAFEFLRDSKFDEPNYFDPIDSATGAQVNPPFRRNQFGGTAGGPIVKNKLFYFGSYEGLRQDLSLTHLARLPNAAAHNGVLPTGAVAVNSLVRPYLDLLYPIPDGRDFGDGTAELRHTDTDPTHENFLVGKVDWQVTD